MADNFNISDIPPEAGPKSVEVPGDIADGVAGEIMTWDAGGVATNVGPGTATQVLTSNGAGAAPSFQAGGGAAPVDSVFGRTGVVVAAASDYAASEVDNDSGVAGAFVDDALNTLASAILANTVDELDSFTANDAVFVGASAASGTARNGHSLIAFDDTTLEEIIFEGVMSADYDGSSSIKTVLQWAAATATSGSTKWNVQFERLASGGQDLDTDSFAAAMSSTAATNATSGVLTYTGPVFSNAAADGIQPGESYRLKVTRDAANVADTMVGDAQLLAVGVEIA